MATTAAHPARRTLRRHLLDGAELWFHPRSGTHVRVDAHATRDRRRTAPRVVMFGITNACNLTCTYCSRDVGKPSTWTVDSAATVLEDLAAAGVLEVAFGGGEPFAFRGFAELLQRLHRTTPLALNVTTNGTLLTAELLARVGPLFGQVRLSLHENVAWRRAAELLQQAGVRWGPNVLVDGRTLDELPALLAEVATLGASDVSLLSYVGPEAARHPSDADLARCAAIVQTSPLPCRVSVCFGRRLQVDRLLSGLEPDGDCGAGGDFVTVTPDRRLQACSFQDDGLPFVDAADLLRRWREQHERLAAAAPRRGCARHEREALPGDRSVDAPPAAGIRVWQAFSGNNSSECHLVARFADAESAQQLVAKLTGLPAGVDHWDDDLPPEEFGKWLHMFAEEGVTMPVPASAEVGFIAPQSFGAIGPTFFAHHDYTLGNLDLLAALAWRSGAACWTGSWNRTCAHWLVGWDAGSPAAAARAVGEASALPSRELALVAQAHGSRVIACWRPDYQEFAANRGRLEALAGPARVEFEPIRLALDAADLRDLLQRSADPIAARSRLWLCFPPESAARFAATIDDHEFVQFDDQIVVDRIERMRRLAQRANAVGGVAEAFDGERLESRFLFHHPERRPFTTMVLPEATIGRLRTDLRARLEGEEFEFVAEVAPSWQGSGTVVRVRSGRPLAVLATVHSFVRAEACGCSHELIDVDQPAMALRRLLVSLRR